MHALALVLATSLALGPAADSAPPGSEPAGAESGAEPAGAPLPDVGDDPDRPDDDTDPDPAPADAPDSDLEAEPAQTDSPDLDTPALTDSPEPEADPELQPEPPAPRVEPAAGVAEPVTPAPLTRDRLGCHGGKTCKRMTIGGIVLGSLGLVGIGTGVGLLVRKDVVDADLPIYVNSTRPAGLVAVTISTGVTLTAVLMLVAAHRSYRTRELGALRLIPGGFEF